MRVRILSGNATGSVVDVAQTEGETMLDTGYAALAPPAPVDLAPADPVGPTAEGASLADPDESDDVSRDAEPVGVPAARVRTPRTKKQTPAPTRRRKRR